MLVALLASAAVAAPTSQPASQPADWPIALRPAVTGLKIVASNWPDASSLRQFGLDAIRLENAKTDEQKAIAIWRWVRRCTMASAGGPACEPGNSYLSEPMLILNVYGDHHCDGLSRMLAAVWQATMGLPAEKLYRAGHTMADLWWVDADGVSRYHMFDVNYGYFLYSRDGSHIVTCDEIGTDFSLSCLPSKTSKPWLEKQWWMYSAIHCQWEAARPRDMTVTLRTGEQLQRMWFALDTAPLFHEGALRSGTDPDGAGYDMGPGAGSAGIFGPFTDDWESQLAAPPVNVEVNDRKATQKDPGRPAELIYHGRLPWVTADVSVRLHVERPGTIAVDTSIDGGRAWRPASVLKDQKPGDVWLRLAKLQPAFEAAPAAGTARKGSPSRQTPIGRYDYLLRVTLDAGAALSTVDVATWFQHNPLVMPTLLPGTNKITVSGKLAPGQSLEVTYVFDDADAKDKFHVMRLENLPAAYEIKASGKAWKDVWCRSMLVRAVPADGKGDRVVRALAEPKVLPDGPMPTLDPRVLNCLTPDSYVLQPKDEQSRYKVVSEAAAWELNKGPFEPRLRTRAEYVKDLSSPDEDTRRFAAAGLIVLRDPDAWDALEKVAIADASRAKYYAVQALFWTDAKRAWPLMEKILARDPSIAFAPDATDRVEAATHLNMAAMVAALCGKAKIKAAVPLIADVLLTKSRNWPEPQWGMIRALGRIGDPAAIPTVRRFIKGGADHATVAMEALIELNDRESIPKMVDWLGLKGHHLRPETAMRGLAAFKAAGHAEDILPMLTSELPVRRSLAADALAVSGQPEIALPALKAALETEKFELARQRMAAAIKQLESRQ
ncbi:MAG: hypothetical protein PHU85_01090 [Phycisphaerae bacterium]|nr:hypothetical protein [Phycisphaerae bacterium]